MTRRFVRDYPAPDDERRKTSPDTLAAISVQKLPANPLVPGKRTLIGLAAGETA